jgi:hypothetical protein
MIGWPEILLTLGAVGIFAGLWSWALVKYRRRTLFEPLVGQVLEADARALPGASPFSAGQAMGSGALRYRYVVDGKERIGTRGNPWGLVAIPERLPDGNIRVWYNRTQDEAYCSIRPIIIPPGMLMAGGILAFFIGLLGSVPPAP